MVLAAGPDLVEDIRKAPENVLSMLEPVIEVRIVHISLTYTYENLLRAFNPIIQ
jgi:hypothetical protein